MEQLTTLSVKTYQDYLIACQNIGISTPMKADEYWAIRQSLLQEYTHRIQVMEKIATLLRDQQETEQIIKLLETKVVTGALEGMGSKLEIPSVFPKLRQYKGGRGK